MGLLSKRLKSSGAVAALAAGMLFVGSQPAQAGTLDCRHSGHTDRIATVGACASGDARFDRNWDGDKNYAINMTVVDNSYDGTFAALDRRQCAFGICDPYVRIAEARGKGEFDNVRWSKDNVPPGVKYQLRVCASGIICSDWVDI